MTPIREAIARAILYDLDEHSAAYIGFDIDKMDEARVDGDCNFLSAADAVLRALDEAGLVVVHRDPSGAMVWGACSEIVRAQGRECQRCPPFVDTPYGPGTQACRLEAADIYRAAITAAKEPSNERD